MRLGAASIGTSYPLDPIGDAQGPEHQHVATWVSVLAWTGLEVLGIAQRS